MTAEWLAVGNLAVPGLAGLTTATEIGEFVLYYRGSAELPASTPIDVDVRTLVATAGTGAPQRNRQHTAFRVDETSVSVWTSVFNEDAVYLAEDPETGRFVWFTDLLLAALILPALGKQALVVPAPVDPESDATIVSGVRKLAHSTRRTRFRARDGWHVEEVRAPDWLDQFHEPRRTDPLTAGRDQLAALTDVIGQIAAERPGAGFATLLSGGIDSGAVTYLAARAGFDVLPHSVGTPWGNEFSDAEELCAAAGLELCRVDIDEDTFAAAVPSAVRWLGTTTPEVVEIALTATAVYENKVIEPGRVLLTGYGSDLINAGLFTPFTDPRELIGQCADAVRRTRMSGELTNRAAVASGVETFHPFWTLPVMSVALETAPECKVREGREKFHLRTAMAEHVPHNVAWRRKIAVHHGGGLQDGVRGRVASDSGQPDPEQVYRACFTHLLTLAGEGQLDSWDAVAVYEAAVAAVR
ncbi:asparagine synthase-related protein [Lentzea rhizosphaerae]|uniref:Asparagine synthase-related protein n=1 Tax=Lentzea rhizosphaerae TaxID=2041025 RepID=A0ABV8BNP5_9PSEU